MRIRVVSLALGGLLSLGMVAGCVTPQKPEPPHAAAPPPLDLNALYEKSIGEAAVKRPSYEVDLTPIDKARPEVDAVSFYRAASPPFDPKTRKLVKMTWISLPPELQQRCRQRGGDPVLALEEILGMPPEPADAQHGDWQVASFSVPMHRVFRPCASSPDVSAPRCSLTIPKVDGSQADFVYRQMWDSYETGGQWPGYPFTGLGWTWDWGPDAAPTHFGVSEYVVRPATPVTNLATSTPAEFCSGNAPPTPVPAPSPPPAPKRAAIAAPVPLGPATPPPPAAAPAPAAR